MANLKGLEPNNKSRPPRIVNKTIQAEGIGKFAKEVMLKNVMTFDFLC